MNKFKVKPENDVKEINGRWYHTLLQLDINNNLTKFWNQFKTAPLFDEYVKSQPDADKRSVEGFVNFYLNTTDRDLVRKRYNHFLTQLKSVDKSNQTEQIPEWFKQKYYFYSLFVFGFDGYEMEQYLIDNHNFKAPADREDDLYKHIDLIKDGVLFQVKTIKFSNFKSIPKNIVVIQYKRDDIEARGYITDADWRINLARVNPNLLWKENN